MAFDEAKFRASAKAAGYSDAEIDAELKGPAPAGAAPAPSMDDTFAEKEKALRKEYDRKVKEATTTEVSFGDNTFSIPTFFTSPAGIVTAAAAGIGLGSTLYGAGSVAPKVYQSIKDRWMTKTPEIDRTIDIPLEATPSPTPNVSPTPLQQTNLTPQEVQARADRLKAAQAPAAPAGAVAPGPAPELPISTPISAAPIDAPAPTPSAAPGSFATETIVNEVKDMIQKTPDQPMEAAKPPVVAPAPVAPPQELRTGTGKPAFAGMGPAVAVNKKGQPKFKSEYADINAVPRDYAFVPGADKIDTLRNTLGQQAYTEAYKNRPFPLTNEMAMQEASEINRMLGRPTRAELIAAGLPPAANTAGITQPTNPPKGSGLGTKTAKVGGVLGALIAIPDLAKAETPGQRAMAATNLLEAVLPPGFMMGSAGEGSTLSPDQMQFQQNAMLLGSPYAQTELAKKRRQALEYAAKVGGGRGLTPASAYQR